MGQGIVVDQAFAVAVEILYISFEMSVEGETPAQLDRGPVVRCPQVVSKHDGKSMAPPVIGGMDFTISQVPIDVGVIVSRGISHILLGAFGNAVPGLDAQRKMILAELKIPNQPIPAPGRRAAPAVGLMG